ncbi:MAG: efflux RND transporter periplasmic adaptor subunit [Candidatus Acidiferrales bacterium]
MHLGRTSLRIAGLLAAGRRRRKLRTDLKVSEQVVAGETTTVIKVPGTEIFLRLPEFEWAVLSVFDGTRTDRDALDEIKRRHPSAEITLTELEDYVDSANPELWEKTLTEKNLALLEKIRSERRERARERSLFYLYFSAFDPDRFFDFLLPYCRWLYTRKFLTLSSILFLVAVSFLLANLDRVLVDTAEFYNFREKSLGELLDFWLLLLLIGFVHETAHGLTCKNWGGEVHQMGFMLIYFTPAFYTDVSDLYLFDKDYKRFWVIFSGIWIETSLCAISVLVWSFTAPGTLLSLWSYKLLLMTSLTGLLMNLNPLMKYDGYYALCQILKIDNLREDSFDYLKRWLRHYLSGGPSPVARVSRRKHRLFLVYGPLAFLYSILWVLLFALFFKNVAVSRLGAWGWVLLGGILWLLVRKQLAPVLATARHRLPQAKEVLMRWRESWQIKTAAAAALVLLVAPLNPVTVVADFILEAGERAEVRPAVAGLLREIRVREGQAVEAGEVVAVLHNLEIEARGNILERQRQLAELRLRAARSRGDVQASHQYEQERQGLQVEWSETQRQRDALQLRSPLAGVVTTPQVEQRRGAYLKPGELFAVVAARDRMRARVLVRDSELEEVRLGADARLRLRAYPLHSFRGRVEQILPAAAADQPVDVPALKGRDGLKPYNYMAVALEIPNPERRLVEGMTGTAKIYGPRYPWGWRLLRGAWRWLRSNVWM